MEDQGLAGTLERLRNPRVSPGPRVGRLMSPLSVTHFQTNLVTALISRFGEGQVAGEWTSLTGEESIYSPRIDVAVGPFATGAVRHAATFDGLLATHAPLIARLVECHRANVHSLRAGDAIPSLSAISSRNVNARCFMAIEIENKVSRKHILGGLVNIAALGKLGIVVAWTPEKLRAVLRMRRYLLFLASVEKNSFDPTSLCVLSREQAGKVFELGTGRF